MATAPLRLPALAVAIAGLASSGVARADSSAGLVPSAQAANGPTPPYKATRRGGFMLGLDAGFGLASIVGYPNDVTKIGFASAYTVTGVRPATLGEAWFGAAITDWINFGIGATSSLFFDTGSSKARSLGGLFRIEGFPLYPLGGRWRDLGLRFDAGVGSATITDPGGNLLVDSSFASIIGGGIFWEGLRAWKTAHGPMLVGNYVFSDTARRPAIFLGWRSVLYSSP